VEVRPNYFSLLVLTEEHKRDRIWWDQWGKEINIDKKGKNHHAGRTASVLDQSLVSKQTIDCDFDFAD